MITQTFTLLLFLAALAASGLCAWSLARFFNSDLPAPGSNWAIRPGSVVRQVHTASGRSIVLHLRRGQSSVVAVRAADVDLSVNSAHADPAVPRILAA